MSGISNLPRRTFLDTNVVNFILDFGPQIFDGETMPEELGQREISDIKSFILIFQTGQRALWEMAVSPFTFGEIIATNNPVRRTFLERWFFEMWNYWRGIINTNEDLPDFHSAEDIRVELLASSNLRKFPDIHDRILICDAIVYNCDAFCTRDFNTIIRYRETLRDFPIRVITPSEWGNLIKPWANLFY
jgi:hypothetical protein